MLERDGSRGRLGGGGPDAQADRERHGQDERPGARHEPEIVPGTGNRASPRWSCRVDCGRDGDRPNQRRPAGGGPAGRRDRRPAARRQAADRGDRPRVVPARRDGLPGGRPAARGRLPDHDRPCRRARGDRPRAARADRPARRRDGAVRRGGRHRGRADHRLHRDGPDRRDRPGEPRRGRPAGDRQRQAQGGGRRRGPVLPARSGELRACARSAATWAPTPAGCAA